MTLWGANNIANNVPKFATIAGTGGNPLYTNNQSNAHGNTIWGVNAANVVSTNKAQHQGWQHVSKGTGPVELFTVTVPGSGFANGETLKVSGGTVNATGVITTNAAGNMASVAVSVGGEGFINDAAGVVAFNREKHMMTITVTGGTGYVNGDIIQAGNGTVNATAVINTNGSGVFTNAGITIATVGLWANTKANTNVEFSITNSTGGATLGSSATLTANLGTSTGGTVTVKMGGRANRIFYETLVAMKVTSNTSGGEYTNLA